MSEHHYVSSAPLRERFGTNYAPSRRELAEIESFLPSTRRELLELSAKIDELRAQQSALKEVVDSLEALRGPIRQIPREILQEIFHHCLPTDHLPTLDNSEAPLLLTRVCHSWRALAQDMPGLWSHVRIVVPRGSEAHVDFHRGRVKRWLACTKAVPVTISLWSRNPCPDETELFEPFFTAILPHSSHIQTLSIDVADTVLEGFLEPPQTTIDPSAWPLLRKVVLARALTFENVYGGGGAAPWALPLWKAPNLKHIAWNSVFDDFLMVEINWARLEGIEVWWEDHESFKYVNAARRVQTLCMFSARDVRRILHHAPLLRELRIRIAGHDELSDVGKDQLPIQGMPKTLVLQHLTKLNLWDADIDPDTTPTVLLRNLQLPALQELTYTNSSLDEDAVASPPHPSPNDPPLLQFLKAQKQRVGIKKFTVSSNAIPRKAFLECLRLMPDLEQLWVRSGSENIQTNEGGDEIVEKMTEWQRLNREVMPDDSVLEVLIYLGKDGKGKHALCPKLHSIRFDRSQCTFEGIRRLVEQRSRLSQLSPPRCAKVQRLSFDLQTIDRPTWVPRNAPRLATCSLEEELRDMGTDATIQMHLQNGIRVRHQPRTTGKRQFYIPKEGLSNSASRKMEEVWL